MRGGKGRSSVTPGQSVGGSTSANLVALVVIQVLMPRLAPAKLDDDGGPGFPVLPA